jgi:hypothetical protein
MPGDDPPTLDLTSAGFDFDAESESIFDLAANHLSQPSFASFVDAQDGNSADQEDGEEGGDDEEADEEEEDEEEESSPDTSMFRKT